MARVKSNLKGLASTIAVPITGPGSLTAIGEFVVKRIQGFTRLGFSLADNPPTPRSVPLKPLSANYVKYRTRLARGIVKHREAPPVLDQNFKPKRSQLTFTGQMLRSIKYKANPQMKTVSVFVDNSSRSDGQTNVQVAKENIAGGRPFMGVDKEGIETIKIRYIKALYRRLGR